MRVKSYYGFQTGDIVKADIPKGKYQGTHKGKVACRKTGYFDIKNINGKCVCQGISYKYLTIVQREDGWQYEKEKRKS